MPAEAHYSRWVANEAIDFIQANGPDQPWMLWVNFYDPHHPFVAPDEHAARVRQRARRAPIGSEADLEGRPAILRALSQRSYAGHARGFQEYTAEELDEARVRYWAMIDLIDEEAGRILHAAEEAGEPGELLVLFTSDHGEMLGDHGLILKGPMMYEGAVRVPCILRWPGRVPSGQRVAGLVSLVDVARTLSEAAGVKAPDGDQGRSLVAVAAGDAEPHRRVVTEYRNSGHPHDPPVSTSMIRDDRYKAIVWHGRPEAGELAAGELYDLDEDPQERHNLWPHTTLAQVRAALLADLSDVIALGGNHWGPREAAW